MPALGMGPSSVGIWARHQAIANPQDEKGWLAFPHYSGCCRLGGRWHSQDPGWVVALTSGGRGSQAQIVSVGRGPKPSFRQQALLGISAHSRHRARLMLTQSSQALRKWLSHRPLGRHQPVTAPANRSLLANAWRGPVMPHATQAVIQPGEAQQARQ